MRSRIAFGFETHRAQSRPSLAQMEMPDPRHSRLKEMVRIAGFVFFFFPTFIVMGAVNGLVRKGIGKTDSGEV